MGVDKQQRVRLAPTERTADAIVYNDWEAVGVEMFAQTRQQLLAVTLQLAVETVERGPQHIASFKCAQPAFGSREHQGGAVYAAKHPQHTGDLRGFDPQPLAAVLVDLFEIEKGQHLGQSGHPCTHGRRNGLSVSVGTAPAVVAMPGPRNGRFACFGFFLYLYILYIPFNKLLRTQKDYPIRRH